MPIEISRSTELPIALDVVKKALRISPEVEDDDDDIRSIVLGETRRYEDFTRRVIFQTVFRCLGRGWFLRGEIDIEPVRGIAGVFYRDGDGAEHELASSLYHTVKGPQGVVFWFDQEFSARPELDTAPNPVWIDVSAGVDLPGDSSSIVPLDPSDERAILHMVKHVYDHDDPLTEEQLRQRFSGRRLLW